MTRRDFYNALIEFFKDKDDKFSKEISNFSEAEITKMDERNSKRVGKLSKAQEENIKIIEKIKGYLADKTEFVTAADIGKEMGYSTNKIAALVKKIEGIQTDKVKGSGKSKTTGYKLG